MKMEAAALAKPMGTPVSGSMISRIVNIHIGPMPLPVFAATALVASIAVATGKLPNDVIGGLLVMMLAGFLLAKLGQTIPVLKQIGGAAILCLFIPSALLGYGYMPDAALKAVTTTFKTANFQYFFIACLVVGSILGMPRRVLIQGFLRMFVPLLVGSIAAVTVGMAVGALFGHNPKETFFFVIVPIIGGGLAEGVLPLSIGYSEMLHRSQAELVALMVPAALLGNVVAIIGAGLLVRLTDKNPRLNGQGMLMRSGGQDDLLTEKMPDLPIEMPLLGAGLMLSCGLFALGSILAPYTGIPGPIIMIISAVLIKLLRVLPAEMELGAYQMNRFMSTNLTFATLVAMGACLVSWQQLMASFNVGYITVCTASVVAMITSGFLVGKWINLFPVEAAVVTACHSGLGGTGDVAILGACDRMNLMAFAQISTRVGGAIMIVLATFLMKIFY
jgi:malate:Na+ symporter